MNRKDGKDDRKVKTADVYSKDSGVARKYPDYRAAVYPDQYVIRDKQVPEFKPGEYDLWENNCQTFAYLFIECLQAGKFVSKSGTFGEPKLSWLEKFRDKVCIVACYPIAACCVLPCCNCDSD